jgi:truncated hemoglobin YjbI
VEDADVGNGFNLYEAVGGKSTCRKLSSAFYGRVARDPVLRPYFPGKTLKCAIEAFAAFLAQFLGGPSEDAQRRWWLSLRESHLRFKIGQRERDAWMKNMIEALDDVQLEEPARSALRRFFERSSAYIVNIEETPAAADDRDRASGDRMRPGEGVRIGEGMRPGDRTRRGERERLGELGRSSSRLEQEIGRRWNAQRLLDEAVDAIRRWDAERAIALAEAEALQTHFERNRSVFAALLALMIRSGERTLLDHVHGRLSAIPTLAREHYSGRTLLHEAAAAGSVSTVELLLRLGADADAGGSHTALYCVGNECSTPGGAAVVRVLVQAGANVDVRSRAKQCTALHMAARRGNVEVAEALLDCGADIEARDSLGETPLRRAVNCDKTDVAALLLSRGANRHSRGSKNLTPSSAARSGAMRRIFQP